MYMLCMCIMEKSVSWSFFALKIYNYTTLATGMLMFIRWDKLCDRLQHMNVKMYTCTCTS